MFTSLIELLQAISRRSSFHLSWECLTTFDKTRSPLLDLVYPSRCQYGVLCKYAMVKKLNALWIKKNTTLLSTSSTIQNIEFIMKGRMEYPDQMWSIVHIRVIYLTSEKWMQMLCHACACAGCVAAAAKFKAEVDYTSAGESQNFFCNSPFYQYQGCIMLNNNIINLNINIYTTLILIFILSFYHNQMNSRLSTNLKLYCKMRYKN